jgi:hypothetical protein
MVAHSNARIAALTALILEEVIENKQAFTVSDVKADGTVFVKFRSCTQASSDASVNAFSTALWDMKTKWTQVDDRTFRLALDQFAPPRDPVDEQWDFVNSVVGK